MDALTKKSELSDEVLTLVDLAQKGDLDMPRGDLQGVAEAIIQRAYLLGKSEGARP